LPALIRWFVGNYQVNMAEAANPHIGSYLSFNDFFTRALWPGVRLLADATLICPVDGAISQFGAKEGEPSNQKRFWPVAILVLLKDNEHGVNPKNVFVFKRKTPFKAADHPFASHPSKRPWCGSKLAQGGEHIAHRSSIRERFSSWTPSLRLGGRNTQNSCFLIARLKCCSVT
jgi:hypothetical protein